MTARKKSPAHGTRKAVGPSPAPGDRGSSASAVTSDTSATPVHARWAAIDLLRGVAIVAMIVYHLCFDLAYHGWIRADFAGDWRWIWFRIPILGSFLFVSGVSLALSHAAGESVANFWRRVGKIALAAALVSAGSYLVFPQSYIYFGVLHAIALMTVLARPLFRFRGWMLPMAVAIIAIGNLVRAPVFDIPWLNWIGMMTFKPRTEDYVPLFPWFGMLLLGAWAGSLAIGRNAIRGPLSLWRSPRGTRWLGWLGRHSLIIYLIHQPLMLGAMMFIASLAPGTPAAR